MGGKIEKMCFSVLLLLLDAVPMPKLISLLLASLFSSPFFFYMFSLFACLTALLRLLLALDLHHDDDISMEKRAKHTREC